MKTVNQIEKAERRNRITEFFKSSIQIALMFLVPLSIIYGYFVFGGESGTLSIPLDSEYREVTIKSEWGLTTQAVLSISGYSDCNVRIEIPKASGINLEKGAIKYHKQYE